MAGPAGTGKSTIARTVADTFADKQRPIAGYFFKRGEQGRNDTSRLFPTLAMQLAEAMPNFRSCLRKSLDALTKEGVEKKALEGQFHMLLSGPLKGLEPVGAGQRLTIIIIVDALDECERVEHLSRIVALLCELHEVKTVRARVFLTSRSAPNIANSFEPLIQLKRVRMLQLHREFSEDTEADIRVFLKARFATIKAKRSIVQEPWPEDKDLDRLVQLATTPEPLFIYAATLCRFVYDEQRRPRPPKKQLKLWLEQCDDNKPQLHQIYDPILSQMFQDNTEAEISQQLQFLGALVLLASPLSAASLAALLDIDVDDDVNWWLPELHSVLDIPAEPHGVIRLLHKSFSDFLLRPEDSTSSNHRVDQKEIHAMLATKCIQRMQAGLKRDICDFQKPDIIKKDIEQRTVDAHIPADLRYACLHWIHHLLSSKEVNEDDISTFLYEHFLHWLEALSLLGELVHGAAAIGQLIDIFQVSESAALNVLMSNS